MTDAAASVFGEVIDFSGIDVIFSVEEVGLIKVDDGSSVIWVALVVVAATVVSDVVTMVGARVSGAVDAVVGVT